MNKAISKVFSLMMILALVFMALPLQHAQALGGGSGTISLTTLGSAYTQNFDTLANTGTTNNLTINGWYLNETGSSSRNKAASMPLVQVRIRLEMCLALVPVPARNAPFGTLFSGTLTPTIGTQFTNNTGSTVTTLDVSYVGEMWRAGVTNRNAADRLDFQLSTNATSLTTGTWVDYNSLDYNSSNINTTAGAVNGNSVGNQSPVSFSITGLSIPNGSFFSIRWNDSRYFSRCR